MTLNGTGLAIGTNATASSRNLLVEGNAIISDSLSVGASTAGNSTLTVNGAVGFGTQSVSDNVTLNESSYVFADTTSGKITVTLPAAASVPGRIYNVTKTASPYALTLDGGGTNIDASPSYTFSSGNTGSIEVVSNGSQWWLLSAIASNSGGVAAEPAVPSWTPASITTTLWLDASDSSTVQTDGSGNVSQWNDKSGNDNHVGQVTGTKQPSYANNIVTFGADDDLSKTTPTGLPSGTDAGAIYMVTALDTNSGTWGNLVSYGNDSTGQARTLVRIASSAEFSVNNYGGGLDTGYNFVVGTTMILGGVFDSGVQYGFVDGSATPTSSASAAFNTVISSLHLSGRVDMGDENQPQQMREVIILSDTTKATRQKVEGYLAHKWGLNANLTGGHPYATTEPVNSPIINSAIADDLDNNILGVDAGDNIVITFDGNTNKPTVSTKSDVDALISFGSNDLGSNILGSDYTGAWNSDGDKLTITVVNATGSTVVPGIEITVLKAGNLTYFGEGTQSQASILLSGDFGDSSWTPAAITTSFWVDASDTSTVQTNGLGTVSQWNDKSGNDNHVGQVTGAMQPSYANNIVTFGTDDDLSKFTPTGLPSGTDACAIYMVTSLDANSGTWGNIVSYGNDSTGQARSLLRKASSAEFGVDSYAGRLDTGYNFVVGTTVILGGIFDSGVQYGFVDG